MLVECIHQLDRTTEDIAKVVDLIHGHTEPQNILNMFIFVIDLNASCFLFLRLKKSLGKLLEYINHRVDQLLSDEVVGFYQRLNDFSAADSRHNFFDSLNLKMANALLLGQLLRQRLEQKMPVHEFGFSIDIDLCHDPRTVVKKLLITVYHQLKKEEEKLTTGVKRLEKDKSSVQERKNVDKNFLIEVF